MKERTEDYVTTDVESAMSARFAFIRSIDTLAEPKHEPLDLSKFHERFTLAELDDSRAELLRR